MKCTIISLLLCFLFAHEANAAPAITGQTMVLKAAKNDVVTVAGDLRIYFVNSADATMRSFKLTSLAGFDLSAVTAATIKRASTGATCPTTAAAALSDTNANTAGNDDAAATITVGTKTATSVILDADKVLKASMCLMIELVGAKVTNACEKKLVVDISAEANFTTAVTNNDTYFQLEGTCAVCTGLPGTTAGDALTLDVASGVCYCGDAGTVTTSTTRTICDASSAAKQCKRTGAATAYAYKCEAKSASAASSGTSSVSMATAAVLAILAIRKML